jgi:hypothetical protein
MSNTSNRSWPTESSMELYLNFLIFKDYLIIFIR